MANVADLLDAAGRPEVRRIVVTAELADVPMVWLAAGQVLEGANSALIRFAPGQDGLQLSADNTVENLQIATDPERRALFNDTSVESLGRLRLRQLRIQGTVRLLACEHVRHGHVEAEEIDIVAADARQFDSRPKGFGVEVVPGAFTLWNQQSDPSVAITATLTGFPPAVLERLCGAAVSS